MSSSRKLRRTKAQSDFKKWEDISASAFQKKNERAVDRKILFLIPRANQYIADLETDLLSCSMDSWYFVAKPAPPYNAFDFVFLLFSKISMLLLSKMPKEAINKIKPMHVYSEVSLTTFSGTYKCVQGFGSGYSILNELSHSILSLQPPNELGWTVAGPKSLNELNYLFVPNSSLTYHLLHVQLINGCIH